MTDDLTALQARIEKLTIRLGQLMCLSIVTPDQVWEWRDLAREYAVYVADAEQVRIEQVADLSARVETLTRQLHGRKD